MTTLLFTILVGAAYAQDDFNQGLPSAESEYANPEPDRDPAALVIPPRKRNYAGGADEEDLRVQPALATSEIKVDARTLQRDVYKGMFNQELKEERHDDAEE